jgi:hypothetical protein
MLLLNWRGFQGGFVDWNGQSHENADRVPDAISRCFDAHCSRQPSEQAWPFQSKPPWCPGLQRAVAIRSFAPRRYRRSAGPHRQSRWGFFERSSCKLVQDIVLQKKGTPSADPEKRRRREECLVQRQREMRKVRSTPITGRSRTRQRSTWDIRGPFRNAWVS